MPLLISIILGGTWIPAKDQIPNPMIGRKIRKVINTPVIMGVVRIWTLSRRGPPVGMVELDRPVEEDERPEEDDEELGRNGNGRSCRLSIGWVPVKSIM